MNKSVILVGLVAGAMVLGSPGFLDAGLVHRWSFSETGGAGTVLVDSVGGANGTIVDLGPNNGTVGGGQVTLAGGGKDSSDYVSLPADIITGSQVTIETWATQQSVQNWSRIFDFGQDTSNNVLAAWTVGTNLDSDRAGIKISDNETSRDNALKPYTLGQQFHIAVTIEDNAAANGQTRLNLYKDGVLRGTVITPHQLASLNDINNFLGRSQYGDDTASASWNELRIYDEALSAAQLAQNARNGPNTVQLTVTPKPLDVLPIHRWSFSETGGAGTILHDSIGGADGAIVDNGSSNGTVGGGQVTLAGGGKDNSDYVQLPAHLIGAGTGLTKATIEAWATEHTVRNWSRIFDFGQSMDNNLLLSWTQGTNLNSDRLGFKVGGGEQPLSDAMAPYNLDQEYHIVLTVEDGAADGNTLLTLYLDGEAMGAMVSTYTLSQLLDDNNFLGRSQYGDETANASWNEFRLYDYILSPEQVLGNFRAGADVVNTQTGVIPEPATLALLAAGAVGLCGYARRRRKA